MKIKILLASSLALAFAAKNSFAQVNDVSVIVVPMASYNAFDKKTTVDDGLMYGFQAGFGFGKIVELTGSWERSANLKQSFGAYESDINRLFPDFQFKDRSVNVERYGGQIKFNIPTNGFAPYILLGTGVQTYKTNFMNIDFKSENLYTMGGVGFKINMGNFVTLNLEGKAYTHKMKPSSIMYDPTGTSEYDNWLDNRDRERMINFGINAGLQFYIGGNSYGPMSDLDRAYYRKFTSGMTGVKFTLAPMGAYVDFNKKSGFRSNYFLGGELGVDLSEFVTLKGYYMQGLDDNPEKNFQFDYIAMMGLDFVGKLNVSRGIVPFISVGGGYVNVQDKYKGQNLGSNMFPIYQNVESGYYAKGGAGIEVPVSKNFDLFGGANIFYTIKDRNTSVTDIINTDELMQHTMYNVGIRFKIGGNANVDAVADRVYQNEFAPRQYEYNNRIKDLENELLEAYKNNDANRAKEILDERNRIEEDIKGNNLIRLTPKELESLIEQTINGVENETTPNIENRLERLEQLLINMNNSNVSNNTPQSFNAPAYNDYSGINDRLLNEINLLKQQINSQNSQIAMLQSTQSYNQVPQVVNPNTTTVPSVITPNNVIVGGVANPQVEGVVLDNGLSTFIGMNFGDATTFNIGVRGNYGFSHTPIIFMPELYVGLGENNCFGISANAIYPFAVSTSGFTPYVGLGLGLNIIDNNTTFNPNFIGGVSYKLNRGSLFADYTARGAFRNNQIAFGYRFKL